MILGGLAALPLFLSAETIRTALAAHIEAATGRATRIDGPVSFSVLPTARLSAEGIGIAGLASDTEAFSVESVSFGLSLLPLIGGNIEIYGITITRPSILIETYGTGRTNWSSAAAEPDAPPASIEDMIAAAPDESAPTDAIAILDRLSIGRVTIAEGRLVWRDGPSGREERIEAVNLDIRLPELNGAGTIEGSFARLGVIQGLKIEIGERPDPTRFESMPVTLTLSSDAGTMIAAGTAISAETYFSGTVEAEGNSFVQFARVFGVDLPAVPAFGKFQSSARIEAGANQIRIDQYAVDLGGLRARGGAAIGLDRTRPGIGLKIEAERVDTALFVGQAERTAGAAEPAAGVADNDETIDFSALDLVDANVDFSAREVLIGAVPVTNLNLNLQIVGGGLNASIRSATVNGAPGNGALVIDRSGAEPAIKGNIEMNGLDAAGLVLLSGIDVPVEAGAVGLDVAFTARGATRGAILESVDGSGRISLVNGHVTRLGIAGQIGGDASADEIDDVDVVAEFTSLAAPVAAKGGFSWRGDRFDISARGEPRVLAMGGTSAVSIEARSTRVDFGFSGDASLSGLGKGTIRLSGPSLRDLLAWVGRPLAPGGGFGSFSINGLIALADDSFSFENAAFSLDASSGVGNGRISFGGTPKVTAGLAMKTLDVTPYLVASGATRGGGSGGGTPSAAGAWSNDRIAFDGLRALDASLNFKAEQILADKIRIGPASLTVTLSGGRLSAELAEMALYSGTGAGTLTIDGAAATPSIAASFRLLELSALPFLTDALGFTRVEGRGSFAFDLQTTGASEAALVAALDGKGAIDVRDGAIRGVNIPKMVRNLSIETLLGWQQGSGEKTDFSELSGSFTIARGMLTNDDLVIVGPLLRVTGAGRIDIPNRTLAYRVDPKIVASLDGQGGSGDLEGFAVPIRVEGSWDRPRIYPEIEGILQDPQKALDQLRKLGGGLFGGSEPQSGSESGQSVEDKIKDEAIKGLDKLFGGSGGAPPAAEPLPEPAPFPEPPPDQDAVEALPEPPPLAEPPQTEPPPAPPADPATDLLKSLLGQ